MKLRYSTTSPYARKVYVVALETRVAGQLDRVRTDPWDPTDDLPQKNPLGKVPALILDDGRVMYDSVVIAEYLDSLHDGRKIFPPEGEERWTALRLHALGDGMVEAAILRMIELQRRPPELRWPLWVERQRDKIERSLKVLEKDADELQGEVTIGNLTIAIALDYLDFRFRDLGWRNFCPKLTLWHETFASKPTMQATRPKVAA